MTNSEYIVERIPAVITERTSSICDENKLKVAAYCRVSTGREEQLSSYTNQSRFYTELITSKSEWELVGIYADKGTATKLSNRKELLRLLDDCKEGKVDMIITKSVSRLCRNTLDFINIIEQLESYNVDIFFEKENLKLSDKNSRFVLNILSSIAEEESLSISQNVKWAIERNYRKGKVRVNTNNFIGYEKDTLGKLMWDIEDGNIIYMIFEMYLEGLSFKQICQRLKEKRILAPKAKEWNAGTIYGIINNEKYFGDAILQKYYTKDFITKERKRNKGEKNMYVVKNSHEALLSKEMRQAVEKEKQRRKQYKRYSNKYPLSNIVVCSCGNVCGVVDDIPYGLKCVCKECKKSYRVEDIIRSFKQCLRRSSQNKKGYDEDIIKRQNLYEVIKKIDRDLFLERAGNKIIDEHTNIVAMLEKKKAELWQNRIELYKQRINKRIAEIINRIKITDQTVKSAVEKIYIQEAAIEFALKNGEIIKNSFKQS